MKKIFRIIIAMAFIGTGMCLSQDSSAAGMNPLAVLKKKNYRHVVDNVVAQLAAELPNDIHFRLLAIGPIEGDDGSLADALTVKIKTTTKFKLIERKDLDKILEEQGIQLSPITDPRKPIEVGKIQGVEGLLLGRIDNEFCSFLFCSLRLFVKLDNVERGEVVFARHFEAQYWPPLTIYAVVGACVLVLIVFFVRQKKKTARKKAATFVRQDSAGLQGLQSELKKCKNNLNLAHDELVAKEQLKLSADLRDLRERLDNFLFKIEQSPGLHPQQAVKSVKSDLKAHSKSMRGLVKNILAESENVLRAVKSGEEKIVRSAMEAFNSELKNASNRYLNRVAGKA